MPGTRNTQDGRQWIATRRILALAGLIGFAYADAFSLAISTVSPVPRGYSHAVWLLLALGRCVGLFAAGAGVAVLVERTRR